VNSCLNTRILKTKRADVGMGIVMFMGMGTGLSGFYGQLWADSRFSGKAFLKHGSNVFYLMF